MDVRQLRPDDDRSRFRSGDSQLDRFFREYAGQNQFRLHIGVTYVAEEAGEILGFATVAPGALAVQDFPATSRKGLPGYPVPVLRLARLAASESSRGKGVGFALLLKVFELAAGMSGDLGCAGILVDAKQQAVDFYKKFGFWTLEPVSGTAASRPEPTAMFLEIAQVLKLIAEH